MSLVTTDKLNSLYQQGIKPTITQVVTNTSDITNLKRTATSSYAGLMSTTDKQRVDNYANIVTVDITLKPADWVDNNDGTYTQIVTVSNLDVYNNMSVAISPNATSSQVRAAVDAEINDIEITQDETGVSFTLFGILPTINIPILLSFGTSMNVVEAPIYVDGGSGGGSGQTDIGLSIVDGKINITYDDGND